MPSNPNQLVRDYIVPIGKVKKSENGDGIELVRFLGTGFFVSDRFLITAAHVVKVHFEEEEFLAAMKVSDDGSWTGHYFSDVETHPKHDVALLKMHEFFNSPLLISSIDVRSGFEYHMFGYPEDAMYELTHPETERAYGRPDLVYYKGYIRRRLSFEVFSFTGNAFFELSEPAHKGCSGSPIFQIKNAVWTVVGIYLGIRVNNENLLLSYALRFDALEDWTPSILGQPFFQMDNQ